MERRVWTRENSIVPPLSVNSVEGLAMLALPDVEGTTAVRTDIK
jgi:hypothetical protein